MSDNDALQRGQVQGSFLVSARHQVSRGAGKRQRRFGDYRAGAERTAPGSYQVAFALPLLYHRLIS